MIGINSSLQISRLTNILRVRFSSIKQRSNRSEKPILIFLKTVIEGVNMSSKKAVNLDDEQIAELREIFRSFDRNNDGGLTQLELSSLLRSLGLKPSPEQLEGFMQKADTNNNGLVEFSEFVALVAPDLLPAKSPYTEEQLKQLFSMFDRDGNGFITAAELAHSMAKLGHALTAEELTGMIKEADSDGDGRISFQEFSQAISSAAFDNSWA
ncbi:probable calcium-binding protein CML17 [Neltuma alba]|uniref:probable calcium-binding protein CML17 n=1 Tax=Neltuma alba TaxID=207710 RepID=UPI0010A3954B|nr:probable calcium-binding protein CML17 [Prosopis alba]XP_028754705.1 probable calcium-binding protein CML17 [Prosopis alba]XP_028754706.1 probable calcium-binding protein CML17 [Prosopis alba]